MKNPFSHSGVVTGEAFCNRSQELKDLIYHAKNSQNVLLYSHRRMGKTSLIHQLMRKLDKQRPKVKSIYIDLYGSLDVKDFIEAVFSGIAQIETKLEKLLKLVSGLRLQGNLDPMTGQPSVSVTLAQPDRSTYLNETMKALARYSTKRKLLVVFDEFQEINNYSFQGFEKRLRSEIQTHSNIAYIFSGSQKHILTQMFNTADRAFYQMATSYPLKRIKLEDYVKWATAIFKKRDTELDESIAIDVVERCDYHPMYIQQFLFELWQNTDLNPGVISTTEMKILARRENEFMILWDSLTTNQRKALRLLSITGGQGVYNAEILHKFGFNSGSILKRALTSLISREIVTKNKVYHIHDAMLKKWVLNNFYR
ncbi:MAG: ATP-binding protein [Desulfobacteraceae bacterium]|nr:ATP-binding protein [Desulfobacteraceae bacterium]